jgi:septal ring factor EnvC (AmiA/AmiB activator)
MRDLTVKELEEKIKQVEEDLKKSDSENGRTVLSSYIEYLEDELKEAKQRERQKAS